MATLSDNKATNVLLLIVVGVTTVSAFLAAGLAILFMPPGPEPLAKKVLPIGRQIG